MLIYRHVGAEAIITWCLDETCDLSGAVDVVFHLCTRIASRGEEYRTESDRRDAELPRRAAHRAGGGRRDGRRQARERAARRHGQHDGPDRTSSELDRPFLVSAEALALIALPNEAESKRMPPTALKGNSQQDRLYAIARFPFAERDEWCRRTQPHA